MTFNEYQQAALSIETDNDGERSIDSRAFHTKLLGLIGETGEFANCKQSCKLNGSSDDR